MRLAQTPRMKLEIPGKVADVMTRDVVAVDENDTLEHLIDAMKSLEFRHLPVTDDDRLIGLVTERDLLRIATSSLLPHQEASDRVVQERFRVRDIMVREVVTVSPDTSLQEAGKILLKERFGCLPVVDAANVLVGILTSSDYIKVVVHAQTARGPRFGSQPDEVQ
jgi:CBS domain-containing membrane protein